MYGLNRVAATVPISEYAAKNTADRSPHAMPAGDTTSPSPPTAPTTSAQPPTESTTPTGSAHVKRCFMNATPTSSTITGARYSRRIAVATLVSEMVLKYV